MVGSTEYGVRDATNNNMLIRMRMVRWQNGSMAGGGDRSGGLALVEAWYLRFQPLRYLTEHAVLDRLTKRWVPK